MRLLLQRVHEAGVSVDGDVVAATGSGLLVLVGFGPADDAALPESRRWNTLIDKLLDLRIFPDSEQRMNLSLRDFGGEVLLVSQFTLYADCSRGRRPSFQNAARPDVAAELFRRLVQDVASRLPGRVRSGVFGADMDVRLVNWGPVTIMLDDDTIPHA